MGYKSKEELFKAVRGFVNRLTEKEFTELRKSATKGWDSYFYKNGFPSKESLDDFIIIIKRLEVEYRCRMLKWRNEDYNYKIVIAIFFAVNERYMGISNQ